MNNKISKFKYLFFSNLIPAEKELFRNDIYKFIRHLRFEYNSFFTWYNNLFYENNDLKSDREIIICQFNETIAGISILKKSENESKICTLRVASHFQQMGIGKELVIKSIEWLENEKPLITVRKSLVPQFEPLFSYFGFHQQESYHSYYRLFSTECSFNGVLPDKKNLFDRIIPANMTDFLKKYIYTNQYTPAELSDLYINNYLQKNLLLSF